MEEVKTALVTGSSSGIGKAIALELSKEGYFVLVHYNGNKAKAEDVLTEIKDSGGAGQVLQFNVVEYSEIKECMGSFYKEFPKHKIKALVNNAGITKDNFFALMSEEDFESVIRTNLLGTMNVTHCLIRHMMRVKGGGCCECFFFSRTNGQYGAD